MMPRHIFNKNFMYRQKEEQNVENFDFEVEPFFLAVFFFLLGISQNLVKRV